MTTEPAKCRYCGVPIELVIAPVGAVWLDPDAVDGATDYPVSGEYCYPYSNMDRHEP